MKVAFYVNNAKFSSVDCRNLEKGNPGIGGTPYLIILVATMLAKRNNGIDVTLFIDKNALFPEYLSTYQVSNCLDAIINADENGYDYIILNSRYVKWESFDFKFIRNKLKLIPWCHNFCSTKCLDVFNKENKIARFVTVGREQLDLLRDHSAFSKGDYIYNIVPSTQDLIEKAQSLEFSNRNHNVVYIGSLLWAKSFHVLASIWKSIKEEVPDAQLFVIGTGNLYNKEVVLGKYGLTSESYENLIVKNLLDENGNIDSSVHFLGKLGLEKYDILMNSKVGVPNPTGKGETFCLSAVEMQLLGCTITAMESPGYYDTVVNGILVKNNGELKQSIVSLLTKESPIVDYESTLKYIKDNFSIESVIKDWEQLLLGDFRTHIHPIKPLFHPNYRLKKFKEYIRILKTKKYCPKMIINLEFFYDLYYRLVDKIQRLYYNIK